MLSRHSSRASGVRRVESRGSDLSAENEIQELKAKVAKLQVALRASKQELEDELEAKDEELGQVIAELAEAKAAASADRMTALSKQDHMFAAKMEDLNKRRREVDIKLKQMTTQHKAALKETVCYRTISHSRLILNTYYTKLLRLVSARRFRVVEDTHKAQHAADLNTIEELNRKLAESVFSATAHQHTSLITNLETTVLTTDSERNKCNFVSIEPDLRTCLQSEADWCTLQREYNLITNTDLRDKVRACGIEKETRALLDNLSIQWDEREGIAELRRAQDAIKDLTSKLEVQMHGEDCPKDTQASFPTTVHHTISVATPPDVCEAGAQTDTQQVSLFETQQESMMLPRDDSSSSSDSSDDSHTRSHSHCDDMSMGLPAVPPASPASTAPAAPSASMPPVPQMPPMPLPMSHASQVPVRGHDGRPLEGYTIAVDGATALTPQGNIILAPDSKPVEVDEAGWPCDSVGGPLKLLLDRETGKLTCLSVAEMRHGDRPVLQSTEGEYYLESGTQIVVRNGAPLTDDKGYAVLTGPDGLKTEDGKVVAAGDAGPIVWSNGKAAVAEDGTLLSQQGGTVEAPDRLPVKINAAGNPVTSSGVPVTLLTDTVPPLAMVAHPQTGLFVDGDGNLRTATGDKVVTVRAGQPTRSKEGELVIVPTNTGIPVLEGGGTVLLQDAEARELLTWEDGSPVLASSDRRHVLGKDGKKVHGVRVSEDLTVVTPQGAHAVLVCLEDGSTSALIPTSDGLFENTDGDTCTASGVRVALDPASNGALTSYDGRKVVEHDSLQGAHYELEDGGRVAVDTDGALLSLNGKVCAEGDDGRTVLDTTGTPLVGPDSKHCVLNEASAVVTSRGASVHLGVRDGSFVPLVQDGEYFMDRTGSKCLVSGEQVDTTDDGDVLRASNGEVVLKGGHTADGLVVTQGRWRDGSAVVATKAGEVLGPGLEPLHGIAVGTSGKTVNHKGTEVKLVDTDEGVVALEDCGGGLWRYGAEMFLEDGSKVLLEGTKALKSADGKMAAVDISTKQLVLLTRNMRRATSGVVVQSVRGVVCRWEDTGHFVVGSRGGIVLDTSMKTVVGVRHCEGVVGEDVYFAKDAALRVAKAPNLFRHIDDEEDIRTRTGEVVAVQNGSPVLSGGEVVIRGDGQLQLYPSMKRVAVLPSGDVLKRNDGTLVVASSTGKVEGVPDAYLSETNELVSKTNIPLTLIESPVGNLTPAISSAAYPGVYQTLDQRVLLDSKGHEVIDPENRIVLTPEGPAVLGTDRRVVLTATGDIMKAATDEVMSYKVVGRACQVYIGSRRMEVDLRVNNRGRLEDELVIIDEGTVLVPERVLNGVQLYSSTTGDLVTCHNERIALTHTGTPLTTSEGKVVLHTTLSLTDGTPVGLASYNTPFIYEGFAVPLIDGTAIHRRQTLLAAGCPVHGNRHNVLVTDEGKVVACDYTLMVEVKDQGTGQCVYYDQERIAKTQQGLVIAQQDNALLVVDGLFIVKDKSGRMMLEDGTDIVKGAVWSDGMPITCVGKAQPTIRTRGPKPVLGSDGKEVIVVNGDVYTSDRRHLLELKVGPDDRLTVLSKSPTYPTLYTDNEGRLSTKEGVCAIKDNEPLMTADGAFIVQTPGGSYTRQDNRGKVILKKGKNEPLQWADGTVATTGDMLLRAPDGRLVEGAKVAHSGRVVNYHGVEVEVLLQPDGTVVCVTPCGEHWKDALGRLCTQKGELIATDEDGTPLRSADGRLVLHSSNGKTKYFTSETGTTVACTADGSVALWETGYAMICGSDNKTLLNPKGEPVHGVVITKEGQLNKGGNEVVVVPSDPPLVLRRSQGQYVDEAEVPRVRDGRCILLNNHGVPYYSKNQVVVAAEDGSMCLEDGTPVAMRDTRSPMTWPDGSVVTSVPGMSIVKGVLHNDVTKRRGAVSHRGAVLLESPHPSLWEREDGTLCLIDDRTVYTKEGVPVQGSGGYLIKESNKLEDGTPVAKQYGEPLLWADASPAVVGLDRCTLLDPSRTPVTGPDGRFVIVDRDGALKTAGGQDVVITMVEDKLLAMMHKRDLQGKICRAGGQALYTDQEGVTRFEKGEEVILVDDHPVPHAAGFVIKMPGRMSVSGDLRQTVVCNTGRPVVWKDGTAVTSANGKVEGVPGVFATPKGCPVDKQGNEVLLHLNKENEIVPLVKSVEHQGLYTSLYDTTVLFTEEGLCVELNAIGWPLRDHTGRVVTRCAVDGEPVFRLSDGTLVAKQKGHPLTTFDGVALTRSGKGVLSMGTHLVHEVHVISTGALVTRESQPCVMIFGKPPEQCPQVLTPALNKEGKHEATPFGQLLWMEADKGTLHTEKGEEVLVVNGCVVIKKGKRYVTEDGHRVGYAKGRVLTWGNGKVVTAVDEGSTVIEGPDGRQVESREGKVVLNFSGEPCTTGGEVVALAERGVGAVGLVYATTYKGRVLYHDALSELCLESGEAVMLGMDGEPLVSSMGQFVLSNLVTEDGARCAVNGEGRPLLWENGTAVTTLRNTVSILNPDGMQPVPRVKLTDDSRVVTEENEQAYLVSTKEGDCYGVTPLRDLSGEQSVLPDGRLLFRDPNGIMCLRSGTPVQRSHTPLNTSVTHDSERWGGMGSGLPSGMITPQDRVFASPLKDVSINTDRKDKSMPCGQPQSEWTLRSQLNNLSEKLEVERLERLRVGNDLKMEKMKVQTALERVATLKESAFKEPSVREIMTQHLTLAPTPLPQPREASDDILSLSPINTTPPTPHVEVKLHVTPANPSTTVTQYTTTMKPAHLDEWGDTEPIVNPACITLDEFS